MSNNVDKLLDDNKESSRRPDSEVSSLVDEYLASIKYFESETINLAKSKARTHKWLSGFFALIAVISVSAVAMLTPLKEVEVEIVRVNDTTGAVETIRAADDAKTLSYGDDLDKYFIYKFVRARNGYEWETIQNDFNVVATMSNRKVFSDYERYIKAEESPLNVFGDDKRISIETLGYSELPQTHKSSKIVQVTFVRTILNNDGNVSPGYKPTRWEATMTFNYTKKLNTAQDKQLNPLFLKVTSYRESQIK